MPIKQIIDTFYQEKDGESVFKQLSKIVEEKEKKEILSGYEIEQGDVLIDFPKDYLGLKTKKYHALVIGNYTCDIPKKSTNKIYILPIYTLEELRVKLLISFIKDQAKKETRENINVNKITNFLEVFRTINREERVQFINYIRKIFQFKNRNYFLICPHNYLDNKWCFIDVQSILPIIKTEKMFLDLIKYTKITINSPWKERFGAVIGSRFDKIAVNDFAKNEIKQIIENL